MARRALCTGSSRRAFAVFGASLASRPARAQDVSLDRFPGRPIRLIVPFGAGGNLDTLVRLVTPSMSQRLGQSVVVENRAGAGGNVGTEAVARAQPDGYTLLVGSNGALTINPVIMPRLPYDALRDFAPIALGFRTPNVLVASRKLPVDTLAEFIAYAKARSGTVGCGSAGTGTSNHLLIELLNSATGAGLVHIPYRASGAATPDLLAGTLAASMEQITIALPLHRSGQVRIIGIAMRERSPLLPEVPTLAEVGLPDGGLVALIGFLAPAGTPVETVAVLRDAVVAALADPVVRERVEATGSVPAMGDDTTPVGFTALLRRESELSRRAAEVAGLAQR